MRIFLDANIQFSAAKSDGAIRQLLALLRRAGQECVVDDYVVEEARRNLAAKFPAALPMLRRLVSQTTAASISPHGEVIEALYALPEKGRPVLASAIRHRCSALVTGDRTHFGALYGRTIGGVAIHSPRSPAEALM